MKELQGSGRRHRTRTSPEQAAAIEPRLPLLRDPDDEVVAGHVREAAKVRHVVKLRPTGGMGLVAAGREQEGVARDDLLRRSLPKVQLSASANAAMSLDLHGESVVRAAL